MVSLSDLKSNWRVVLLVVVVLISVFALFSPTLASGSGAQAGGQTNGTSGDLTNVKYGLELSGGTRITAPLAGVYADGVNYDGDNVTTVQHRVADNIDGVEPGDVAVRSAGEYHGVQQSTNIVEIQADNVSASELDSALSKAGYAHDDTYGEVSEVTRTIAVNVLRRKINEAGLSGGTVSRIRSGPHEHYVQIEVPNENRSSVMDLVESRGQVTVQVYYKPENSSTYTREVALRRDDFSSIGAARQANPQRNMGPNVPVVVKDSEAERFQRMMVRTGVAQQGGSDCSYQTSPNSTEPCLLVVQDGEVVNSFGMVRTLANSMRSGDWAKDPRFILTTRNYSEAQRTAVNLRAGALPTNLDMGSDSKWSATGISASQASSFKTDSLIAGVLAVLAVSGVVFLRYGQAEVALPMIVTALSEVVILLGFAAGVGYPLDLSVIAGFIAAIGTGVDDLIIIADEVMAEGEVNSRRVFQSRFRRAFWVIGAAAATTIVALSPLAILSLGDLKGFAIFTILGVLVGVLITRPAYGDILRALLTDNR